MTKYKDLAHRIGFTMSQLADIMGYSRQALYQILSHVHGTEEIRWAACVRAVKFKIESEYQRELADLNARYTERRKAAEELLYINTVKEDAE